MSILTLEQHNHAELAQALDSGTWIVACLCAAWCDVCCQYRPNFEQLAARHPDLRFVWIDIEDQADVVGEIDVENFPTLLIQRGDTVAFFGTVLPDARLAERLLLAQTEKSPAELQAQAQGSAEHRAWQEECNLRQRLREALG
jgi:thioredoxin-like negative regulator of GroEL